MDNKSKAIKAIKAKFDAKTRENIAQSLITICVSNYCPDSYIKAGLIRKTRSKKYRYMTTETGDLFLEITKIGKAFNSLAV